MTIPRKIKLNKKKFFYFLGFLAEILIIARLSLLGYRIVRHRYRSTYGEIDIVAIRAKAIFFIEVKARRNSTKIIGEVLTSQQQHRIKQSANHFISHNIKYNNYSTYFILYHISLFSIIKFYL